VQLLVGPLGCTLLECPTWVREAPAGGRNAHSASSVSVFFTSARQQPPTLAGLCAAAVSPTTGWQTPHPYVWGAQGLISSPAYHLPGHKAVSSLLSPLLPDSAHTAHNSRALTHSCRTSLLLHSPTTSHPCLACFNLAPCLTASCHTFCHASRDQPCALGCTCVCALHSR
jgi:hypothetical protein